MPFGPFLNPNNYEFLFIFFNCSYSQIITLWPPDAWPPERTQPIRRGVVSSSSSEYSILTYFGPSAKIFGKIFSNDLSIWIDFYVILND